MHKSIIIPLKKRNYYASVLATTPHWILYTSGVPRFNVSDDLKESVTNFLKRWKSNLSQNSHLYCICRVFSSWRMWNLDINKTMTEFYVPRISWREPTSKTNIQDQGKKNACSWPLCFDTRKRKHLKSFNNERVNQKKRKANFFDTLLKDTGLENKIRAAIGSITKAGKEEFIELGIAPELGR